MRKKEKNIKIDWQENIVKNVLFKKFAFLRLKFFLDVLLNKYNGKIQPKQKGKKDD